MNTNEHPYRQDARIVDTSHPDIESQTYWRRKIDAPKRLAEENWGYPMLTRTLADMNKKLEDWCRQKDPRSIRNWKLHWI